MEKHNSFTEGKILKPLLGFCVPILLAMFLQVMYGAIDMIIVGKFAEAADVSAISTGSQIMHAITMLIMSLAVGTTVLLGQKIGARQAHEGGTIVGASIMFFFLLGLVVTFAMTYWADSLASIMQAPPEAFDKTVQYVRICSLGMVFIIAYNLLGGIFRGMGNSRLPLMTVAIACVCNIVGDLLLVAYFHLATAGAAIATVAAQALSVGISFLVITKMQLPFELHWSDIRLQKEAVLGVLRLGVPLALQDLLVHVSFLVVLGIVNSLGLVISAGVGIADKVIGFIMLVPGSFAQAVSAFVAQNIGAGKPDRARRALYYGIGSSLVAGCFMFCLSFFRGDLLAYLFTNDKDLAFVAMEYMKAFSIDCLLTAFLFCFIGYFNGCGRTKFIMWQGIIGAFAVRIPFAYFASTADPVSIFYIGLATPVTTLFQIVLCGIYFRKAVKS